MFCIGEVFNFYFYCSYIYAVILFIYLFLNFVFLYVCYQTCDIIFFFFAVPLF